MPITKKYAAAVTANLVGAARLALRQDDGVDIPAFADVVLKPHTLPHKQPG